MKNRGRCLNLICALSDFVTCIQLSDACINRIAAANDYCSTPDVYRSIFTLVVRALKTSSQDKEDLNNEAVMIFIDALKAAYDASDAAVALQTLLATI